jgi:dTMP kinase
MTGKLIAFEGGEGAGKTTQVKLLAEALEARGIACDLTREPGGTAGAEAIRKLLLDPPSGEHGEGWPPRAEALLFAAARADHVAKRIRPALAAGTWVLADRFIDSSRAYQGGAGELGDETILTLHQIGSEGLRPDLTILIEANPAQVSARLEARDGNTSDAIGGRDASYHRAVADAFRRFAKEDPNRFAVIDGTGSVAEVHQRIIASLASLLVD